MSDPQSPAYTPIQNDMLYRPTEIEYVPSKSLYISHFISTWNSRGFEFGAILFLATVYPGTLLPMSIYALVRAAAAILFAPWVGRYIDRSKRLVVVRLSIIGQRIPVVLSCLGFLILTLGTVDSSPMLRHIIFTCLVLLACVEKLCSVMNTVAVERDWVVVIAGGHDNLLQELNSQMRRIDLFCKLISPLVVALLDGYSTRLAIITTLGLNIMTVAVEYFLIATVYNKTPTLARTPFDTSTSNLNEADEETSLSMDSHPPVTLNFSASSQHPPMKFAAARAYVSSAAFLPSFSLSILYLTVLSFSGQMTTYLLAVPDPRLTGVTVGLLRMASTVFELSSTFIAPQLISTIGPVRAGIWCLSWQALCLTSGVGLLLSSSSTSLRDLLLSRESLQSVRDTKFGVIALIITVILSRVGLWSFDLVAQLLIQNSIESSRRGSFSSMEASLQNFFELCTFATTILWSRPEQFKYPAMLSVIAVWIAGACYAKFVRDQRGHLLHLPPCLDIHWSFSRKQNRSGGSRAEDAGPLTRDEQSLDG